MTDEVHVELTFQMESGYVRAREILSPKESMMDVVGAVIGSARTPSYVKQLQNSMR